MIGTRIGRYEILEELGAGGMSVVYKGLDTELDRLVAVKVLHDHLARKADNRERLRREARAIAKLRHPNILEIYDYAAQTETRAYIVMEYVDGMNLREFCDAHGPMPAEVAALLAADVCSALGLAHDAGIIHRDIKPENLMISKDGRVKLMDFGIAHVFDAETMTQTGSLLGSPAHMAPETIEGEQVDARADLFALGTVLYWLTTGALPFDGKNAPQVLKRVLEGIYKAPEALDARVGADFGRVIATCMSFDPDDRYPDARTTRAAMSDFAHELGVLDPDDLSGFLLAPGDQLGPLQEAIAAGLIARAERAIERRDIPAACRHLNRALGYDPSNTRVLALLDRMRKGSSRRTLFAAAAAVAAVAAVGAYLYLRPPAPAPERPEAVAALPPGLATSLSAASDAVLGSITTSTAVAAGVHEKAIADTRALAAATAKDRTSLARAIADAISEPSVVSVVSPRPFKRTSDNTAAEFAAARLTEVDPEADPTLGVTDPVPKPETFTYKFDVTPYFATVYIDGQEKEGLVAKSAGFALTRGTHRVRVTCKDNLCEPYSGIISVDGEQDQAKDIRLKWRNGKINLKTNTNGVAFISRAPGGKPSVIALKTPNVSETFEVEFGVASNTHSIPKVTYTVQIMGRDANRTLKTDDKFTDDVTIEPGATKEVTARF